MSHLLKVFTCLFVGVFSGIAFAGSGEFSWRPILNDESNRVFGALTCNGQSLVNRCGYTTTDCSAPNNANYCDKSSVGTSCSDGLYKGTGSAFGCHKTGGNILCYGVNGPEQRCDATTICTCKKKLNGTYSCVEENFNFRVVESAKESTTNCTPE